MKKLIIALASVTMAVVANAAAVSWSSGTISLPSGSTAAKGDVTAYLFLVDETAYATYSAFTDAAKLSDAVYADYKSLSGYAATATSSKKGAANMDTGNDYSAGTTLYGVILYTTTQDSKDYYMGNVATAVVEGTADIDVSGLAEALSGTSTATAWSTAAVPEPTSGLLMLLGIAGLALRRRRA